MKNLLLRSVKDLEQWIIQNDVVYLFGAGKVCKQIMQELTLMGRISQVAGIFVTRKEKQEELNGIKIVEFHKQLLGEKGKILKAVSERYQEEIETYLRQAGIEDSVGLTNDLEQELDKSLPEKMCEKIIAFSKNERDTEPSKDMLFLSPPFWDVYSPFSAVPCLVGKLRKEGYEVDQKDVGIFFMHYLLKNKWKDVAAYFLTEEFYENYVKVYEKNSYHDWKQYRDAIWFLQSSKFDVSLVKKEYCNLNFVQKRVLDAFYYEIYSRALWNIDFDRCTSIEESCRAAKSELYEILCDQDMISIFSNIPDIVGISITSTCQFIPGCILADLIKQCKPNAKVIMGGSCADIFAKSKYPHKEDILKYFDYIIIGEGETAITKLLHHIKNDYPLEKVPNLMLVDAEGNVHYTEQIIEDVDTLPIPDYDGLDLDLYLAPELVLPYQTSRGCHYGQCAFCNHDEKYRHHYRSKNMQTVIKELIYLSQKYHTKCFQFVDEAIRPDCFREMVAEMDKHDEFKEMRWFYYSRVSRQYDEELIAQARRNGCRMVMFGVESLNQRLLNFIKKGISAEVSKYCLKLFHDGGIKTYAWLLCNLPSETLEEAREDLEEIKKLHHCIDAISVGIFYLYPNTDMYSKPENFNITSIDEEDASRFSSHNNGIEINKEAMLKFYMDEYARYQNESCFVGNRYTVFFES